MKVSGKSASRAPAPAASAASASSLSIVAVRSNATGSACTHATFTVSSIRASLGCEEADELVLGVVVELEVLRASRQDLAPVTVSSRLEQPIDLPRDRLLPGRRGPVTEFLLSPGHVDQERLGRRPWRRPDLSSSAGIREEYLGEAVPRGRADRSHDLEQRGRIRVAAVEDAGPRLGGDETNELADVLRCGRVEMPGAAIRQNDVRPVIDGALEEEPLARHPVAATVDRTRPDDRRRRSVVFQQHALELRLLRRVRLVAGCDRRLRLW